MSERITGELGRMLTDDSRKFVAADPSECTGCGICELVCALEKENLFEPTLSRIKVVRLLTLFNFTNACRFCKDAPCVNACPREALIQSENGGTILVEESKCNGCSWCIQACDYGAIRLHPRKTSVIICDLCRGEPKCVEWCPEGALKLTSKDEFNLLLKETINKKLIG